MDSKRKIMIINVFENDTYPEEDTASGKPGRNGWFVQESTTAKKCP
jgi:hypothetical protein